MIFEFVMLAIGLIFLIKFSSITINRAVKLSRLTGIGEATIGFVLIAVSTSLPELTIAILSSAGGSNLLSFGNLIGSSVSDLTFVFGITAFLGFTLKKKGLIKVDEALIFTVIVIFVLMLIGVADFAVGLFLIILFYLFSKIVIKEDISSGNEIKKDLPTIALIKNILTVVLSVVVVVISAKIVTDSALGLANSLGIAETIIGATILGLGTTLPELSVNITAVRRGNIALAVGDSVGSVVTNMTLILGIAAVIHPISLGGLQHNLLLLMLGGLFVFFLLASRMKFGKKEGLILLVTYATYLAFVMRLAV